MSDLAAIAVVTIGMGGYLLLYAWTASSRRGRDPRNIFANFNTKYTRTIVLVGAALTVVGLVMLTMSFAL